MHLNAQHNVFATYDILTYQWEHGRYEASLQRAVERLPEEQRRIWSIKESGVSLRMSGGVLYMDEGVYFTKPIEGSFGLVHVGLRDIPIFVENQEVGKTDSQGTLLVTILIPYYPHRIAIDLLAVSETWKCRKAMLPFGLLFAVAA